jgi:hypothetical protein
LFGRVTHSGRAVVGKLVSVTSSRNLSREPYYEAFTTDKGTYEIAGIAAGDYAVRAEGAAERRMEIRTDTELDIEVPSTELGGRVLEEGSGIPIVAAGVFVIGVQAATASVRIEEETDHFGRFAATGLEAGDVLISVYKPGYEMYRERLNYGSPVTNMAIRLRRSSGVEIRARTASPSRRHLYVGETLGDITRGVQLRIPLDENGIGSLPSALAGSTLEISGGSVAPMIIQEWNGQPLDLKF